MEPGFDDDLSRDTFYSAQSAQIAAYDYREAALRAGDTHVPHMGLLEQLWRASTDPDSLVRYWMRMHNAYTHKGPTAEGKPNYKTDLYAYMQKLLKEATPPPPSMIPNTKLGHQGLIKLRPGSPNYLTCDDYGYATVPSPNYPTKGTKMMKNVSKMTPAEALTDATNDVRNLLQEAQSAADLVTAISGKDYDAVSLGSSIAGYDGPRSHVSISFSKDKDDEADQYVDKDAYEKSCAAQRQFIEAVRKAAADLSSNLYVIAAAAATKTANVTADKALGKDLTNAFKAE